MIKSLIHEESLKPSGQHPGIQKVTNKCHVNHYLLQYVAYTLFDDYYP